MRLLGWINHTNVNANHRVVQPCLALGGQGHAVLLSDAPADDLLRDLPRDIDVALMHRATGRDVQRVARALHDAGVAIIWDNDDDVADAAPSAGRRRARAGSLDAQRATAEVAAMVRLADVVTTPSARLEQVYRDLGADCVRVVGNFIPDDFLATDRPGHAGVVIGWVAAYDHAYDFRELGLRDALRRLLDAHGGVRVIGIGVDAGLDSERYEHTRFVPYEQLASQMARMDVGIAPMADIPFNRSRADSKLKEYSALGLAWLASPVGPYLGLGEAQGGRLVADGDWYAALERLVENHRDRRKLGKHAAKWAKRHAMSRNAGHWEHVFEEAVRRAHARR